MGNGRFRKACGVESCGVSTAIDDTTLTFGQGDLDEYGFWEKPCRPCAENFERLEPSYRGRVWPRS